MPAPWGLVLRGSELTERMPDELLEGADGIRDFSERVLGVALAEA